MNAQMKLIAVAAVSVTAAVASFRTDVALYLGIAALLAGAFIAVAVLVGAAVSTRNARPVTEKGRASVMDAAPVSAPLQEQ